MLETLEPQQKKYWSRYVEHLVRTYNCDLHDAIGYILYMLMFSQEAWLSSLFWSVFRWGVPRNTSGVYHSPKGQLNETYQRATQASGHQSQKNKTRYDWQVRQQELQTGNQVLAQSQITGKKQNCRVLGVTPVLYRGETGGSTRISDMSRGQSRSHQNSQSASSYLWDKYFPMRMFALILSLPAP